MQNKIGYYQPSNFSLLHHYLPPYSSHRLSFMWYIFGILWKRKKHLRQIVTWHLAQSIQHLRYCSPLHAHECNWQISSFLSLSEGRCIPSVILILRKPAAGSSDLSVNPFNLWVLCVCSDIWLILVLTLEPYGISSQFI